MASPPALYDSIDPPPQRWFGLRRVIVWAFWICACLSVATVIWGLWYVNDKGFTRKWRRMVTHELAKRGVHAHISRLTLNPLQGLVARDVELLDPRDRDRVLARVNELVLDIDYSGLVHGQQFLRAIDLYDARISLPLDPASKKSDLLEISGLNATVRLPPNKVEFDAEATVHGLRVKASARLANPAALRSALAREEAEDRTLRGHQLLRFIDRLEIIGGAPVLEVQIDGDLAHPDQLIAKAKLESGPFTVAGGYRVKSARLNASYNGNGLLRLNQCQITDHLGEFDASGYAEVMTGRTVFHVNSSIDLQGLLHSLHFTQKVDEFVFYTPPLLTLHGEVQLKKEDNERGRDSLLPGEGRVMGSFSVGRFMARSVIFEGVNAEFSWDGKRWYLRDGRLHHRNGHLKASLLQTPEQLRFNLESDLHPATFFPLLPMGTAQHFAEWEFIDAPRLHLSGKMAGAKWEKMEGGGEIALGATRFRNVPMKSLTAKIELKGDTLSLPEFRVEREEGYAAGAASVDLKRSILSLHDVRSTLTPVDAATWIDRRGDLPRNVAPYRFRKPPSLLIDGDVQINGDDATNLRIDVAGRDLDYHFITRDLYFPKIKGTLRVIERRLMIEGLEGDVFGGKVFGNADISIDPKQGDYSGSARAEAIDFPSLTQHYLDYHDSKGKLGGTYQFKGKGDQVRNLSGKGTVEVANGNVFAIPLFGPFSGILNTLLPGTGYNTARRASASFAMSNGTVETPDLEIEGKGFSMYGGGKLFFLDDKIDFAIRINAQGAAGFVLTPVSHLFEYVSDDTLSNPVWRPKRLPKGLFPKKAAPASQKEPAREPAKPSQRGSGKRL